MSNRSVSIIRSISRVPRLWSSTIAAHRQEVRDSILDAAGAIVSERSLLSVTMSEIALRSGVGRATLYRYFPDVEAILLTWHEREVAGHLERLASIREQDGDAVDRLEALLGAYAVLAYQSRAGHDVATVVATYRHPHVTRAHGEVVAMIHDLVEEATAGGRVRTDVSPAELARYCIHAVGAARNLRSRAAVGRLVMVTVDGLRPRS